MIIGLTGGIGSGKTTVGRFFNDFDIPVYIADNEAKRLMLHNKDIRQEVEKLLGSEAYAGGLLNRKYIANRVFKDQSLLNALNTIVHPVVQKDFEQWHLTQDAPYVIKEAAILIENEGYKKCDYTILVTAPRAQRIKRVMARDNISQESVVQRIAAQWSDFKKMAYADAVVENIILTDTDKVIQKLHIHLLRRINQGW